jgi:hypothetical protein
MDLPDAQKDNANNAPPKIPEVVAGIKCRLGVFIVAWLSCGQGARKQAPNLLQFYYCFPVPGFPYRQIRPVLPGKLPTPGISVWLWICCMKTGTIGKLC